MKDYELNAIDRLHALAHENPELPVLVRNVQESEIGAVPENDRDAPYWLGSIESAFLGRYVCEADGAYTLFDDGAPTIWDKKAAMYLIASDPEDPDEMSYEEVEERYDELAWRPAIIVGVGLSDAW